MSVKLHWYRSKNFGDALSPVLVSRLSGQEVAWSSMPMAQMVAAGSALFGGSALFVDRRNIKSAKSMLKLAQKCVDGLFPELNIWGSGFLCNPKVVAVVQIRHCRICATRGMLTLQILKQAGFNVGEVALGDPGLLYPILLANKPERKWDVGVVPHFRDYAAGLAYGNELTKKGVRVKVINVLQDNPLDVVREIGECEKIVSSSLHGLIVSDALGLPRMHKAWSTIGQTDDDFLFKFEDYGTGIGVKDWRQECIDKFYIASGKVAEATENLRMAFPIR